MRRWLPICALVLAMVVSAAPASAAELPSHILQETIEGPPPGGIVKSPGPLQGACGVAVDPIGRVFASSYYGHYVYVFSPLSSSDERKLEATIKLEEPFFPPPGKAAGGPCDLALDADGNLYVNNWHQNVVRLPRLTANPPSFGPGVVIDANEPTSVTVSPSNRVLVDDRTYVAEYDSSGAPVLDGGEPVRIGLGSLGDGYGVAVSDFAGAPGFPATAGLLYVADAADDTVKVYDPDGDPADPVQVIDGDGTPQLGFNHLVDADVAVDPVDGHVYVVDNLSPGFELPEAVVDEFSSLGHYRGPVPPEVANGHDSGIVHGEPTAVAIFEHDVYLTDGNYFPDNDVPTHRDSTVLVYGPTAAVETRTLTATKTGSGAGTVFSSSPAGLGCGTACEGEFTLDRTVLLTARPAAHNRFLGWTGCKPLAGAPAQCELAMDEDRAVSAEFEPIPQQPLTVTRSASGGASGTVSSLPGGIDCGTVCAGQFDEASEVTLTATPAAGSVLAGWSGCDAEPAPGKCRVTMDGARQVEAAFAVAPVPPPPPPPAPGRRILSVFAAGSGSASGTVTSAPAGIACGATCAGAFAQGATVTLVARPSPGSAFLGWGGCDEAAGERCTVALGSDRSVVAAFGSGSPGPLRLLGLAVRGGSATLRVSVPAAGTLSASGPGLRPVSTLPLAAGRVGLSLRLTAAARRTLARRQELRVRVALAFVPFDGGATVRATKAVTFRDGTARR